MGTGRQVKPGIAPGISKAIRIHLSYAAQGDRNERPVTGACFPSFYSGPQFQTGVTGGVLSCAV